MADADVTFHPKSNWQKSDCINRSADFDCPNESTIEARLGTESITSAVRCCEEEACKKRAAALALLIPQT